MNKVVLGFFFVVLLIAAYVVGFVVATVTAYAIGITDGFLLTVIGTLVGGTWAGEFVMNTLR